MATPIKLKRSAVAGKRPTLSDLQLGELALNTYDGSIYVERDTGGVGIATTIANVTPWTENYGGESIYYNNTVGIGTTNPQGSLQIGTGVTVYGSTGIVSATKFYGDGTNEKLNITGGLGAGAGVALATQILTIVGTTNEVDTSADGQQVQIGLPNNVTITNDLIVGSGVSIAGITTVTDTLKVGTAITAHAGIISATKFKSSGGTSAQFLKGDGSLDGNSYLQAESDTLNTVLGRGNVSGIGISVGISTLGNVSSGFVELYHDSSLVFQTVGTGVSIANAGLKTATIYGPEEIWIDPSPIGVGTTSGIVRIKGDLYVDGTEFIVNSETITLGDFVVGIATTATTNALTNGAGIGIGSIGHEKTFKYEYNSGTNPSLKSSENLNVASGKGYQIAQTEVLNATTLGSAVVNSSLTNLGTLTSVNVSGNAGIGSLNVTGVSTFNSTITLKDNVKLGLGDADDLELHHSTSGAGSTSYIDNNKGPLYIRNNVDDDDGGNIIIEAKAGKASAVFQDDEGVRLYFNNAEKFATTNEGINVSGLATVTDTLKVGTAITASAGVITATSLDISGNVDVDGTLEADDITVNGTTLLSFVTGVTVANATNAAGLSGSPNIDVSNIVGTALSISSGISTVGFLTATDVWVSGAVTATDFYGTLKTASQTTISELGTITTGTWQGTAVVDDYIASAATWNDKISNVVDDTTPQLGGNLDGNSKSIDSINNLKVTGITTVGFATATDVWVSGTITATTFKGDLTGNADTATSATSASGLTGTPDITVGTIVGTALSVSGIATVTDTLKVGTGITASAGVITATSFSGSGANLTGLTGASADTYGSATLAPVITVDANGRISTITTATISGGGGGAAGLWAQTDVGINTSDKVGIGTTNPLADLQVGTGVSVYGNAGIVSATTFKGALEGDVTGNADTATNASGLTGTPDINVSNIVGTSLSISSGIATVGFLTATDVWVSGTVTATTFKGDLTGDVTGNADTATSASGLTGNPSIDVSNIVGTALSISGIATVTDTLKVGTAITAHAGIITATKFVKTSGTSTQFLKADGTVDSSTYLTSYTETSTLDDVLGRGNSSTKGMNVGISTLGNVSSGFVKLYNNSNLVFETVGTGVSVSNAGLNTATIFGPPEIIIDPHPVGVATTSGIVRIKGDLYVDGKNFIIDSETITLGDFVVGIASTVTTEALTDGAGIGIGSAGHEKTFKYYYNSGTNPSLKSSENLNVASGKGYQIDQTEVLNATTLGSAVVNSSLTSVGTLGSLTVTNNITANGNIVGTALSISGIATVTDTLKVGTAITAHAGVVTATTFDASNYYMASILTRDKYRFWGNTQWTMGMTNGMTFGGLDSYAITSQVTNHDNRGWVFLDANHTDAQGAMSLNTIGELVVAKSIRAGGGESDTSAPRQPLDIIGDGIISGDVGIGTDNPDTNLHVKGTGTDILKIESTDAGAQGANLILQHSPGVGNMADNDVISLIQFNGKDDSNNNTTYSSIRAVATDVSNNSEKGDLTFWTRNGSDFLEKLRIDSTGRLLLGITASSTLADGFGAAFQIQGTSATSSSISITRNSAGENPPYITFAKSRGTSVGSNTAVADGDNLGDIDFKGSDGAGDFNLFAKIRASVDGTPGGSDAPGRLSFFTTANDGISNIERLRIDSSGRLLINDAATTGPMETFGSAALQVATTSGGTLVLGRNDASTGHNNGIGHIYFEVNDSTDSVWNDCARISVNADGNHANDDYPSRMQFFTTGDGEATPTERLRIDSTGDVRFAGTNLTDSTNKNVNLTAPSYDTDEEDVNLVQVENESGMNQISFGGGTSGLNAATTIRFLTASAVNTVTGTERLRITSDGKVGIATITPRAKFDVRPGGHSGDGAILFTHNIGEVGSSNNAIQSIKGDGSALQPLGYRATEHIFATQSAERLRIASTGRVAIGNATNNASPTALFGVKADDGEAADLYVGQFDNLEATDGQSYGVAIRAGSNSTDHGFRVKNRDNDTTQFLVRGDGNVGIGTDNPTGTAAVTNNESVLAVGVVTATTLYTDTLKVGTGITATAGIITANTIHLKGGNFGPIDGGSDDETDAALIVDENFAIYNHEATGNWLITLLEKQANVITLGQKNTNNITEIKLIPGKSGTTQLMAGDGTTTPVGILTANQSGVTVSGVLTATSMVVGGLTYPTANGNDGQVLTSDGAGVVQWEDATGGGGGISGITIEDEGSALSTLATTLNFVGDGVVASGTGAEKTITISGGGGGASGLWASNATGINTSTNVGIATTTASAMLEIGSSGIATATTMINAKAWDGQTFNVDGNITSDSIFAVNDISGLPVIDFNASHSLLSLAPFGGNVSIGYTNSGTKLGLKGSTSERVHIVADELSDMTGDTINIDNGNVQYFTTAEDGGTLTPNITSNNTLNVDLAIGDSTTVVVIIKPDSSSDKITNITIDGSAVTEEWLGGSAPDGGASGSYDVYTFFILKTADATFLPLCNKVNYA